MDIILAQQKCLEENGNKSFLRKINYIEENNRYPIFGGKWTMSSIMLYRYE